MIKIILSLLITLIIVYAWIWLITNVFVDKKIKRTISLKIFIVGLFMVWSLFIYKYVLHNFWLDNIYFENSIWIQSIWIFILYCIWFVTLISLIYKNIAKNTIWLSIILWFLLFVGIGYGGYIIWITSVLMYYFIAAYAEEIMKFIAWENIYEREWKNNSDLLFFCILVWLGFAIIENLFYLWSNIFNTQVNLMWLSIWRWLVSSLLHVISTWIIAYIVMKWLHKKIKNWTHSRYLGFVLFVSLWMILWFALHSLYNLSLFYNWKFISIPIIILWYFVFNFLMFKSDKIYLKNI